jgi:hypothetical protein
MVQILFFNDKQKILSKQNLKFRSDGMYLESIFRNVLIEPKMDCKK